MSQNTKRLAIVIPAYKGDFFKETLASIANQTCKDFILYVGDDCSPDDLSLVVSEFESNIDLVYHRFKSNLGGRDLVAQWERCIKMVRNQEWIWLFSDDDIMDRYCVEKFYLAIEQYSSNFYHFNVKQIDEKSKIVNHQPEYPEFLTAKEYLDLKLSGKIYSYVVEFIFNRSVYEKLKGFENFDLAWGADFITWIKFSEYNKYIRTISGTYVYWRKSLVNITPNRTKPVIIRKIHSLIDNIVWIKLFLERNGYKFKFFYYKFFFGELCRYREELNTQDIKEMVHLFSNKTNVKFSSKLFLYSKIWILLKKTNN